MRKLQMPGRGSAGTRDRSPKQEEATASPDPGARATPRIPQIFEELVVLAGALSGYPETVWVQETDAFGKPMWEMTEKRVSKPGRRPEIVYHRNGGPVMVLNRDADGKPIPKTKQVVRWKGQDQFLGYLRLLAQAHPALYTTLVKAVRPTVIRSEDREEPRDVRTLEDLRMVLTKRGLPCDYLIDELAREMAPEPELEPEQQLVRPRPRLFDEETEPKPKSREREYDERGNFILPDDEQPKDELRPVRVAEPYYKNESIEAARDFDTDDGFDEDDRHR